MKYFTQFGDATIALSSQNSQVIDFWQTACQHLPPSPSPLPSIITHLQVNVVTQLPALPSSPPYFTAPTYHYQNQTHHLQVYHLFPQQICLSFSEGAQATLPTGKQTTPPTITLFITPTAIEKGRLLSTIMTCLTAILHPYGYATVHGFTASWDKQAVLLLGQPGSGKTTTGMSLVLAGWQFLADDHTLIQHTQNTIKALPSVGGVAMNKRSIDLLPASSTHTSSYTFPSPDQRIHLPPPSHQPTSPTPITHIYLLKQGTHCQIHPLSRAIGLATLLQASLDHWHTNTILQQTKLLKQLAQQVHFFQLQISPDLITLPSLLQNNLPSKTL